MESKTTVRRPVLDYCVQPWTPRHERATIRALARWLAELLDWPYGGSLEPSCGVPANCYLLPTRTLVMDRDPWRRAGQPADLLGGQVDHLLTATKAIVHPRLDTAAPTPPGWSAEFARAVQPVVLPGYTAFAVPEALRAGQRLLRQGPVRIKPVLASGGRGQAVVTERRELEAWLAGPEAAAQCRAGLVLEEELVDPVTWSVGQLQLPGLLLSYTGRQTTTLDSGGQRVYGGSELELLRGGLPRLLADTAQPELQQVVRAACHFDRMADRCFPGLFATRRNYDVIVGRNQAGELRCGVLEQSWRQGGATGAELAAAECFLQHPGRHRLRAATVERYGAVAIPAGARVLFSGRDDQLGPMSKHVQVEDPW